MNIQVLNYSATIKDDGTFRLDAEHYQKLYLDNQKKLSDYGAVPLLELIARPVMTGHTPSMKVESYYGGNVRFVKTDNLREFKVSGEFTHYLSGSGNQIISRSALQEGDLIITIIGATHKIVGRAALVHSEGLPANINQNIALIRLKKECSPEFLSVYLNSKIGRLALWYLSRQTEQVNLNCREVEKILVPDVTDALIKKIETSYKQAVQLEHLSSLIFKEAQNILLTELGLINWNPTHQLAFVKNYSEVNGVERIDAEYFQPKYEEIVQAIKDYVGGWDTLGNLVYVKKCTEVGSRKYLNEGIPFVRVSNISPFEVTEEKYISEALYNELTPIETNVSFEKSKNHQPQKGEVLFSKDGSPGIAHYLNDKPRRMIPSSGILRLKSKTDKVNNEYLTLVLNSLVTQEQIKRDVGGSIILHWRPDQVRQTVIPILPTKKQEEIKEKITKSFKLRKQSRCLLESAKIAVEMAIEEDEQTAIKWLQAQIEADT